MICDRCGVVNRPERIACVQCLGPLANGKTSEIGHCKEHPDLPATGRCVTCGTLVCDTCGGVVANRGVYCIEHTPAITSASGASPGMNPLLAGGGPAPAPRVVARKQSNAGLIAAITAAVGLIVLFVALFFFPGILRSKELPPAAGVGGAGAPGAGPYGAPGMPGDSPYGSPYGPPGMSPYGPPGASPYGAPGDVPYGPPGGPGGAPNGPPGGPMPPGGATPSGA